ncbi:TlpA family protein disulfide reductase [Paludisphaera rhizosphaerae]|uniref:TlpA family protein disulfide reductase n=1 Tax=Paludisphaera rhizosphaerae TaxID=2711216 RepID=UPI001F0E9178|nr:TlpA disulfide reductase family protein [Paludisphaera rhizosphaerae]
MNSGAPSTPKAPRDWTWPMVFGVFAAFWVVYLLVGRLDQFSDLDAGGPNTPVDYEWSLRDLDNNSVKFSNFQGKPLFVNVWATWCPPCVGELPSIARLAATPELKDKVAFVCISTDEGINPVRSFMRGKDWPMTILQADRLPPVFMSDAIPATYLVSAEGRVVYEYVGGTDWDTPKVVAKLRKLVADSPQG